MAAYAVVIMRDGSRHIEVMTLDMIRSAWGQGAAKGSSPAHRNFTDQMAKKTVIARACKIALESTADGFTSDSDDPDGTRCPNVGFVIDHPETGRILFATDCESLSREELTPQGMRYTPYQFTGVVHWMLEANYDDYILHLSDIPSAQKDRIRQSHLSVANAVAILRSADLSQTRDIMLLHMSERNSVNNESKITRRVRIATGKRCFLARAGLSVNYSF